MLVTPEMNHRGIDWIFNKAILCVVAYFLILFVLVFYVHIDLTPAPDGVVNISRGEKIFVKSPSIDHLPISGWQSVNLPDDSSCSSRCRSTCLASEITRRRECSAEVLLVM